MPISVSPKLLVKVYAAAAAHSHAAVDRRASRRGWSLRPQTARTPGRSSPGHGNMSRCFRRKVASHAVMVSGDNRRAEATETP